ncbi:MAG: response regulator transcription factor [Taibaiella sp.]|nr:response regulator transcription factor [Taibaiella sp.]
MDNISIALVEDQQLFRNGLHALLKETEGINVMQIAEGGHQFLELLKAAPALPDVALLDMNMPEMNGFELLELLQKHYPSIKVIILTIYNQERFIIKMVEAGVAGYLVKNCEIDEVILAIRTAYKTGFYFNQSTLQALHHANKFKGNEARSFANITIALTEREIEVLRLICSEYTNAEIAETLSISQRTVDGHRNNLLAKAGCKNTAGLVVFAVNNNFYNKISF